MLSISAGTKVEFLQRAAREFAQVELANHGYVMALHSHRADPHVHLGSRTEGRDGQCLNPRKEDPCAAGARPSPGGCAVGGPRPRHRPRSPGERGIARAGEGTQDRPTARRVGALRRGASSTHGGVCNANAENSR
jgi:hypothetical protein